MLSDRLQNGTLRPLDERPGKLDISSEKTKKVKTLPVTDVIGLTEVRESPMATGSEISPATPEASADHKEAHQTPKVSKKRKKQS